MDQPTSQQAHYEGWTLLELYGHNTEAGYCVTEYFGPTAMLRVDVPEIPATKELTKRPQWLHVDGEDKLCPAGTEIEVASIPGRTRYLGFGAIYSMNPATEQTVRTAIARSRSSDIVVIKIGEDKDALPQSTADTDILPGESRDEQEEEDYDAEEDTV